jgi:nitric oxide dioxygenase
MTGEQIELVASCWQAASPRRDEIVRAFYDILLRRNPELGSMFHEVDMSAQRAKFIGMIDAILSLRNEPRQVVEAAVALGQRHAAYGVVRDHYRPAGAALLTALEEVLGPGLTPELREAWAEAYGMISAIMCRGAEKVTRKRGAA